MISQELETSQVRPVFVPALWNSIVTFNAQTHMKCRLLHHVPVYMFSDSLKKPWELNNVTRIIIREDKQSCTAFPCYMQWSLSHH